MNIKLKPYHFEEVIKKGYSLDTIYILKLINEEYDVEPLCKQSIKIEALYQGLVRKGLICQNEQKLTTAGKELLQFMETKEPSKLLKKKASTSEFEEWWKAFPGTDTFEHQGSKFLGARSLRQNKEACRTKFENILLEGEYTSKQLTEALKYDVIQKKTMSVKTKTNKLTYMQNSLTYLNQRSYEPFIEMIGKGVEVDNGGGNVGVTDI